MPRFSQNLPPQSLREVQNDRGKMKAIAIQSFGGAEQLSLMDLPMPEPKPDEVLIRIRAAGVGWWDVQMRQGEIDADKQQFPLILGWESVGTIAALGECRGRE